MDCRGLDEAECTARSDECLFTKGTRKYCRRKKNRSRRMKPTEVQVESNERYILIHKGTIRKKKPFAGFDLDHTLIRPKSGRKFPNGPSDWVFMYPNTTNALSRLSKEFNIVIVTNQKGLRKPVKREEFMEKVRQLLSVMDFSVHIFVSIEEGYYRKPFTGSWARLTDGTQVHKASFYCGDAAGRKKDFAATDFMYAHNCRIGFYLPEELFLEEKTKVEYTLPSSLERYIGEPPVLQALRPNSKMMALMCGYPGSGKSTLARQLGSVIASNDDLGSEARCKKYVKERLVEGKNVVVDNTNATRQSRQAYYDLAKDYGYSTLVIYVDNNIQFCYYMNQLRCELSKGEDKLIPKVAYFAMRKRLAVPTESECDNLVTVTNRVPEYTYLFPTL